MIARWIAIVPLVTAASCGGDARAGSQDGRPVASACGDSARVSWDPATPREGALFLVRVSGVPPGAQLAGRAAGERLHFTADSVGTVAEALAAAPIDAADSLGVEIWCSGAGRTDTLVASVMPARGEYPVERLRVAPSFGRRPDSALAARTRREAERAAAVAAGSHDTPRFWTEPFVRPRTSRVTSGFGRGREFNGTITSRHMGTDFAGAVGAPVRAANRGVVRIVDAFYYGGNVVYVDHGGGLTSAYLHLSRQRVAVGDTVDRGQVIGAVGATGRVTGPHLHLIVRYGNVTVDPLSLFAIAGDSATSADQAPGERQRRATSP
ncbi:MAG TPA: M23 family metallopeptidase [Gemmatimonadaceae bacterium]|nr:M23 family metallopeptidase [Gemmatimonadaceae bacterium]